MTRFGRLPVVLQACLVVLVAMAGADLLTLVFYSIFFADRLLLDLALTTLIVIVVGYPLAHFFLGQNAKLAAMAAELDRATKTDGLTGLANRRSFFNEARHVINKGDQSIGSGAILFIDVDHFKSVNDTFGHAVGDAVLCELASVLRSTISEGDLAARLGGEEFAVLLASAGRGRIFQVAERIRRDTKAIATAIGLGRREVTVSIGVSMYRPGQNLEAVLISADQSLYAAKAQGRDRIVYANRGLAAA
jgi:diguanylate cyclase (GGDEF)-like protein